MRVVAKTEKSDIATVYLADMGDKRFVEFVESVQPPIPREEKWVIILSMLYGCPVGCSMCDAGGWYEGKLSKEDIFSQIDYLVHLVFPEKVIPVKKFKIQFARMGEPSFNENVLDVLEELPRSYDAPGLLPSLSTIAPEHTDPFFNRLLEIKQEVYPAGKFQLQFSIHTTDYPLRDRLIPVKKWDFKKISEYGEKFYTPGDRKITLNFAFEADSPLQTDVLLRFFNPSIFLIKLTPLNPTLKVIKNKMENGIKDEIQANSLEVVRSLKRAGYEVIVSIGELEENKIGSNCGQLVKRFLDEKYKPEEETYQYDMEFIR